MTEIPEDIYFAEPRSGAQKQKIVIMTADGTEDQEFFYPYYCFIEHGYSVDVITPDGGAFKGKNGAGLKDSLKIAEARPESYALLYIPGGKAPEKLKKCEAAYSFVQKFCDGVKPVAALCHGPQILAKAGVIDGEQIAAWPECAQEVEEAGAMFANEATCVSGQFITGRWPADMPHLMNAVFKALQKGQQQKPMAA